MKLPWLAACALALQVSSPAHAAAGSAVVSLDPAFAALVAADARLETLFERDSIFEGPNWVRHGRSGYLIFSDVPGNVIEKLNADGSVAPLQRNIFTGDKSEAIQSPGGFAMVGPNGITLDRQGRIVYCAFSDGQIVRVEKDGRRSVLASRLGDIRLNALNDLAYKSDGVLYFTDSRAGARRADGEGVPHKGLYLLKGGTVRLLSKTIDHPNGLAFSPDEKHLYVTNTRLKQILRFDVKAGGLANEKMFFDMSAGVGAGAPDGIKVDRQGNVFSSGPGGIWVISAGGKHLGTIATPQQVTNFTFGGNDAKTLYITGFGVLYRIPLQYAGK